MDENSRDDDFSRLSLSLHAIKSALFHMSQDDGTTSESYPHLSRDLHQVALIMRRLELLPYNQYPQINGILTGMDTVAHIDSIMRELKDVFREATAAIEKHAIRVESDAIMKSMSIPDRVISALAAKQG